MFFIAALLLLQTSPPSVQCGLQPFSSAQMQTCVKKLGVDQLDLINFMRNKPQEVPEKILCLFKCEMEERGVLGDDGKLDKGKLPALGCLSDVDYIRNCSDVQRLRACVSPRSGGKERAK